MVPEPTVGAELGFGGGAEIQQQQCGIRTCVGHVAKMHMTTSVHITSHEQSSNMRNRYVTTAVLKIHTYQYYSSELLLLFVCLRCVGGAVEPLARDRQS